jgi:hypothetical protein
MFNFLFKILYSLVSFIVGIFFVLLGIICLILPWSAIIRTDMIEFILENSIAISLFGFGFIVIGITIVLNLYIGSKRSTYYVRAGNRSIAIDEEIIQQYLDTYWKQIFPHQDVPTRLILKKNKIRVIADLPQTPFSEQKRFVERIQHDLEDIFSGVLGYSHEFILNLSFQQQKQSNGTTIK